MSGRPFLQIPGPTLVPERIVRAMSQSIIDHRGPKFAALVGEILDRAQDRVPDRARPGDPVPGLGHGRLGSGRRQHAVARRPGPRDRQRPLLEPLLPDRRGARHRGGPPRGALRRGRARGPGGRAAPRRLDPPGARGPRRPQRDLDGRDERRRGGAPGPRRGAPPGAPARRRRLLPGVDRLPVRRVGRGRRPHGPPEGAHAPARAHDPGGERAGRPREPGRQVPARLLGLGAGARAEQARRVPLHARHRAPLRPPRVDRDARGGGPGRGLPAPRAAGRGLPARRPRARARDPVPRRRASTRTR